MHGTSQKQADDNIRVLVLITWETMKSLVKSRWVYHVCVYMRVPGCVCLILSITSSEQPIEGLKQSPSENSADCTNDNYVDKDRFCHLYSHYCCI